MLTIFGMSVMWLYLVYAALYDIRYKKINMEIAGLFALVILISRIVVIVVLNQESATSLLGVLVGFGVLVLSIISRRQIGIGDAVIIIMCGLSLNLLENMIMFLMALLGSACVGILIVIFRARSRRYRIAFIPFVCISYGAVCIWKILGSM